MSLRDRIRKAPKEGAANRLYSRFGIASNPFPASNQTSGNPHREIAADKEVETRILTFFRDDRSQVVVVEGAQGVGKTNFLNHVESEIRSVMSDLDGRYMVCYLADPELPVTGTTHRLFEELGTDHLKKLARHLKDDGHPILQARSHDMQTALRRLAKDTSEETLGLMMKWLLGLRVLKAHRLALGIQFRLDTAESKTAALRDMIQVSAGAGVLKGVFLLLDELEKQDGVLGPTAVVRYLSALRSVVDALPHRLFLMLGITPDALRRYSAALPALRGRLENQITLEPLTDEEEATELARFYMEAARRAASARFDGDGGDERVISEAQVIDWFEILAKRAERVGNVGVRQREFLHRLHVLAEENIRNVVEA